MAGDEHVSKAKNLVAVLLVARLQPGPRLVFQYPAVPGTLPSQRFASHSDSDTDSESDDKIQDVALAGQQSQRQHGTVKYTTQPMPDIGAAKNEVFGFSEETLQKLLSPGCWSDRKKFEISLDGLTFVGRPMWAAQDSTWLRRHSHGDDALKPPLKIAEKAHHEIDKTESSHGDESFVTAPKMPLKPITDFTHVPESVDSRTGGQSFATSMASGSSTSTARVPERLAMFNVILVFQSSMSLDLRGTISDAYEHILKKLSKALHYCQKQSQYVGIETRKLLNLKAKARVDGMSDAALTEQMVQSSELAWSLEQIYNKISIGEIAGIKLGGM